MSPLLRGDVECIANHNRDAAPLVTGIQSKQVLLKVNQLALDYVKKRYGVENTPQPKANKFKGKFVKRQGSVQLGPSYHHNPSLALN